MPGSNYLNIDMSLTSFQFAKQLFQEMQRAITVQFEIFSTQTSIAFSQTDRYGILNVFCKLIYDMNVKAINKETPLNISC